VVVDADRVVSAYFNAYARRWIDRRSNRRSPSRRESVARRRRKPRRGSPGQKGSFLPLTSYEEERVRRHLSNQALRQIRVMTISAVRPARSFAACAVKLRVDGGILTIPHSGFPFAAFRSVKEPVLSHPHLNRHPERPCPRGVSPPGFEPPTSRLGEGAGLPSMTLDPLGLAREALLSN
jgi:hypothetical protein